MFFTVATKSGYLRTRFRNPGKSNASMLARRCLSMSASEHELLASQSAAATGRASQDAMDDDAAARRMLAQFTGGTVRLDKCEQSGIAHLCIDHSAKKNAFSGSMMLELAECVEQLATWSTGRLIVVRGTGGDFCTGGDLDFVKQIATPAKGTLMSKFMTKTLTRLYDLPIISVAQVEGFCLGGGAELAIGCDLRLMNRVSTRFGFVHGRMGVTTGWGGATRLVQLVGRARAVRAMAAADVYNAEQSEKLGIVDFVYDCNEEAETWIKNFVKNTSTVTAHASKRLVQNAIRLPPGESLIREGTIFAELWGSDNHRRILEQPPKHRSS